MSDALQLPSYFEYLRQEDPEATAPLTPFSFDASTQEFVINGRRMDAAEFDPESIDLADDSDAIQVSELPNHSLYLPTTFGDVVAGPALHRFTTAHPQFFRVAINNTVAVMADVYESFLDEDQKLFEDYPEIDIYTSGGHIGFNAGHREDDTIGLQVLGNCACLGPTGNGWLIEGRVEHGFAEYGLHNADSQTQRASLYAGIGHLAFLADGTPPRQGTLFAL